MLRRKKRKRKSVSKCYDTRKQALNAFKSDYNIPRSEQPHKIIKPYTPEGDENDLDSRNVRLYVFKVIVNMFKVTIRAIIHLREDKEAFYIKGKGYQKKHFNAGKKDSNLKDHYYFNKK